MKRLFMVLCVVIMFFGLVGCPSDDPTNTLTSSKSVQSPVTAQNNDQNTETQDNGFATAPEPATLVLLGAGLVGLAGAGRKKFFKNDKNK